MEAGNEAEFTFRFYNDSWAPMTIPKQEIVTARFFCCTVKARGSLGLSLPLPGMLDMNFFRPSGRSVTCTKKFMSSMPGSGSDNPRDPLALTVQQKNRAVTIEFDDFSELNVTLGCTSGRYARYFMFVARPSLLCARTVGGSKADTEVITVETTTVAPSDIRGATTAAPEEDDCLVQVPVIKFCIFKKAWKFGSSAPAERAHLGIVNWKGGGLQDIRSCTPLVAP
eukprot:CAMPEP_0175461424 /NCGR_PEP_ID=MMETSP0095-20121207/68153_1 /TAXON_ID=311494 /ORGANISM="Alexandrium monilatum, Strain CCMP3105" /LENGTH=224 /DNA_ID=CAMNT_0016762477 /DNA_START=53 /DNA_END=728 /DNA_ORIENTATION=-